MGDRQIGRTARCECATRKVKGIGRSKGYEIKRTELDGDAARTDGLISAGRDGTAINRRAAGVVGEAIEGQATEVILSQRSRAADLRGDGGRSSEVVDQDVTRDRASATSAIRQRATREGQGIGDGLTADIQGARYRRVALDRGRRGPQARRMGQTGGT